MNKSLYLSYECFKENSEYGIIVTLKNGMELFYQFMSDSHKVLRHKWQDTQLVSKIYKEDVVSHISLAKYLECKQIKYSINDPSLFLLLTKNYSLPEIMLLKVNQDIKNNSNQI